APTPPLSFRAALSGDRKNVPCAYSRTFVVHSFRAAIMQLRLTAVCRQRAGSSSDERTVHVGFFLHRSIT
ncbi:hypothetical protein RZS08_58510, partial [Arthrospira platensis SPKY1]|nr:hypothetical protein [Arthrospira platensis SPKY1]